jgi:hypothetical protein
VSAALARSRAQPGAQLGGVALFGLRGNPTLWPPTHAEASPTHSLPKRRPHPPCGTYSGATIRSAIIIASSGGGPCAGGAVASSGALAVAAASATAAVARRGGFEGCGSSFGSGGAADLGAWLPPGTTERRRGDAAGAELEATFCDVSLVHRGR